MTSSLPPSVLIWYPATRPCHISTLTTVDLRHVAWSETGSLDIFTSASTRAPALDSTLWMSCAATAICAMKINAMIEIDENEYDCQFWLAFFISLLPLICFALRIGNSTAQVKKASSGESARDFSRFSPWHSVEFDFHARS